MVLLFGVKVSYFWLLHIKIITNAIHIPYSIDDWSRNLCIKPEPNFMKKYAYFNTSGTCKQHIFTFLGSYVYLRTVWTTKNVPIFFRLGAPDSL